VKESVEKALEIPKVAVRPRVGSPRTGNLINSRPEGLRLACVFDSSNDDGQIQGDGGSTWNDIKIDKLCSQRHPACFVLFETSHVVGDESTDR
jgi:hypothetical protein